MNSEHQGVWEKWDVCMFSRLAVPWAPSSSGFHKFDRVLSDQSGVFQYRCVLMRWILVAGRGWQRASGCVGEVGCVSV